MAETMINVVALVLAIILFLSALALVRPANGTRPLLIGFTVSAMFAIYLSAARLAGTGAVKHATFGLLLCLWISTKLWALYAAALDTRRPFRLLTSRFFKYLFGPGDETT